jgi:hypothetical protein
MDLLGASAARCSSGRFGVRATDGGRLLYPEAKDALSALPR